MVDRWEKDSREHLAREKGRGGDRGGGKKDSTLVSLPLVHQVALDKEDPKVLQAIGGKSGKKKKKVENVKSRDIIYFPNSFAAWNLEGTGQKGRYA